MDDPAELVLRLLKVNKGKFQRSQVAGDHQEWIHQEQLMVFYVVSLAEPHLLRCQPVIAVFLFIQAVQVAKDQQVHQQVENR